MLYAVFRYAFCAKALNNRHINNGGINLELNLSWETTFGFHFKLEFEMRCLKYCLYIVCDIKIFVAFFVKIFK